MKSLLYLAAGLVVALGAAHSVLGERYILTRLFRRSDLPRLLCPVRRWRHCAVVCINRVATVNILIVTPDNAFQPHFGETHAA